MRTSIRPMIVVAAAALLASVAACSTDSGESPPQKSGSPTSASTVTVTESAPSRSAAPVTDVDAAQYAVPGSSGHFRWSYSSSPQRECAANPASTDSPAAITCSAPFPKDSPTVQNDVFTGVPNAVRMTADESKPTITEGGPPGARTLEPGHRITVGDLSCTVPAAGSIDCSGPESAFTVAGGVTTLSPGTVNTPSTPMETYTEGTTPAAPGTQCGAATGKTLVKIVSGEISCTDAIEIVDGYLALPNDGTYGNANIRMYRGFSCSTATAAAASARGYGTHCSKGDIELTVPTS